MSLNKVMLIGVLGKDPIIKDTSFGSKLAGFSMATSERWTDKSTNERKEKTEWHNVVVYSQPLVNIIEKLGVKKGTRVYVEGSLSTRKWTDNNGTDRYTTEVILNNFNSQLQILSAKDATVSDPASPPLETATESKASNPPPNMTPEQSKAWYESKKMEITGMVNDVF